MILGLFLLLPAAGFSGTWSPATVAFVASCSLENPVIIYSTEDTMIEQYSPNTNFGSSSAMYVNNQDGYWGLPFHERDALVRFDLSSLPSGATICSARLFLYYFQWKHNKPKGRNLTCYRITSEWEESEVTWDKRPALAAEATGGSIVPSSADWMDWDVTGDVQDFVDGKESNYGWQIMDEKHWGKNNDIPQTRFRTREYGTFVPYLEVIVLKPLMTDVYSISEATGGTVNFSLLAGQENAFRCYILLGGVTGTSPGIPLPGGMATLPLNWDVFTQLVVSLMNTSIFMNFMGALDASGNGTAVLNTLGPLPPGTAGITFNFAYALNKDWDYVSNPVFIDVVP